MSNKKTFFENLSEIDLIISLPPSQEGIKKIVQFNSDMRLSQYIFTKLKRDDWLSPLKAEGLFNSLPDTKADDLNYPYWYPMDYLLYAAITKPDLVFEIVRPYLNTHNRFVQAGILLASKSFSKEKLELISDALVSWLNAPKVDRLHAIRHAIIVFIDELIKHGLKDQTKSVFSAFLAVSYKERSYGEGASAFTTRDVVSSLDAFDYRTILEKEYKSFFSAYPEDALELLLDILNSAINYRTKGEPPNDYSTIWCKDISRPSLNFQNDVEEILVAACRDYALQYIKSNPDKIEPVLDSFLKRTWAIFKRLRLHILAKQFSVSPELTKNELRKTEYLTDYFLKKEYLELLKKSQSLIDTEIRDIILSVISKGPTDLYEDPSNPTEEDKKYAPIRHAYWLKERLYSIENTLSAEWKEKLKEAIEITKKNEEEHPPHPEGVWSGPNSSKSVDELAKLDDEGLFNVLKSEPTIPKARWLTSPSGLARNLSQAIKQNPNRKKLFSTILDLNPVYIEGFLSGLREGSDKITEDSWKMVIVLLQQIKTRCSGIVSKSDVSEDEEENVGSWNNVKRTTSWLLSGAIKSKTSVLYTDLSDATWDLIEWLSLDKNPSAEFEEKYVKSPMGAYQAAINSIRGQAIECAIHFALKKFNLEKKRNPKFSSGITGNIEKLLTFHVNPANEPSLAVRSVYGVLIPWLVLIDKEWVTRNLSNLFPSESKNQDKRLAVWLEYLMFCQAYDDAYAVLSIQYELAVTQIDQPWGVDSEDDKPKEKLTDHLLTMYWRKKVSLDSGVLKQFYDRAPLELRKHAMSFVGRSIKNTKQKMPDDIRDLFKTLLERRFATVKNSKELDELTPFGWWFNSEHFDYKWRLKWLKEILALGVIIQPDFDVIENLETMKEKDPSSVLDCIEKLINQDKHMRLYTDKEVVMRILSFYIKNNIGTKAHQRALLIANTMGSKGYLEFRDLLDKPQVSH